MASKFAQRFARELFAISPEVLAALEAFPWPGNIRQLENVIQQAVLMSHGPELLWRHLPKLILHKVGAGYSSNGAPKDFLTESREDVERGTIRRALMNHGGIRCRAASALGISRVTLYKKMKKYGLKYGLVDLPAQQPQAG